MTTSDRRTFIQMLGAGTAMAALGDSIKRAQALPANTRTRTIEDVEHIVIMMQENRSFDHYFGTMRGVRGFGDPRAVTLPTGKSVFHQPSGKNEVLPFHPDAPHLGLQFLEDLPHDWTSTHDAWNAGNHDGWVPAKGTTTMAHLTRNDIPFHYALADAFTVCDAYHCSLLGPTDPNRYHMWTGWVGNDGAGGGPVIDNAEAGYGWSTYPERLQAAGITWKVYQDAGLGLTGAEFWGYTSDAYIGNYGDNALLYFHQYQNAQPGSPLANGAKTGTNINVGGGLFDQLTRDVANGTLPQISYIVAPEAYTEHPNWPANYGAWYVSQMLDILTSKPDVWSKTVFFLLYDENDGFFDHMVPPTPPATAADGLSTVSIKNEIFPGNATYPAGPYGLGARVPMIVISPWSKGGYVNSQVFDHTSIIRFIEARFGATAPEMLTESNITPWRRAVTGDLTSAFNFKTPNDAVVPLPSIDAYAPPDMDRHPSYVPSVPATQHLPKQEPGMRFARALPYEMDVSATVDATAGTISIAFRNTGTAAAVFQVRAAAGAFVPRSYTVGPRRHLSDIWAPAKPGNYDLSAYGPNGFYRAFKGILSLHHANIQTAATYDAINNAVTLTAMNHGTKPSEAVLVERYTQSTTSKILAPGESLVATYNLAATYGWYDFALQVVGENSFLRELAGHVETGKDSASDPLIGGVGNA